MAKADGSQRGVASVSRRLAAGDAALVEDLIAGAGTDVLAEVFADLVDGSASSARLVAQFVSACWEGGASDASPRRAKGRKTPGAVVDVPTDPTRRRLYLLASFDAVSGRSLTGLLLA